MLMLKHAVKQIIVDRKDRRKSLFMLCGGKNSVLSITVRNGICSSLGIKVSLSQTDFYLSLAFEFLTNENRLSQIILNACICSGAATVILRREDLLPVWSGRTCRLPTLLRTDRYGPPI